MSTILTDDIIRASYDSENGVTLFHAISGNNGAELLCAVPDSVPVDITKLYGEFGRSHLGRMEALDTPVLRIKVKATVVGNPLYDIEQALLKAKATMSNSDLVDFHGHLRSLIDTFSFGGRADYYE